MSDFSTPWSQEEDRLLWAFYESSNPQAKVVVEALARRGYSRTELAVRSRAHKLRKRGFGQKVQVERLAVNLPWR